MVHQTSTYKLIIIQNFHSYILSVTPILVLIEKCVLFISALKTNIYMKLIWFIQLDECSVMHHIFFLSEVSDIRYMHFMFPYIFTNSILFTKQGKVSPKKSLKAGVNRWTPISQIGRTPHPWWVGTLVKLTLRLLAGQEQRH